MDIEYIRNILDKKPYLRTKLYSWGFLLTNMRVFEDEYPFYGNWQSEKIGEYSLLVAPQQKYYIAGEYILVGHAYNPFNMSKDEEDILSQLSQEKFDTDEFWKQLNQLTGVFSLIHLSDTEIHLIGDATCMQTTFYYSVDGRIVISSHTNMFRDLLDLKWSDYAEDICHYRFFKLLGNALPGDLTQFDQVKRLVPNHYVTIDPSGDTFCKRFYAPRNRHLDVDEVAKEASEILTNNLKLIAQKWNKAAISLTGGCDSKTTLSCASGIYDKFSYFSYISSEAEKTDAEAAVTICKALELAHKVYNISDNDHDYDDIEDVRAILRWNTGDIRSTNRNDVRKRAFFCGVHDFDIEVKSWASEIGRAYYSKRFNGRKDFGKPTPKKCTTLYKFFLNNRKLVKRTDEVFREYLDKYFETSTDNPIDRQEQFFWEFRVPSWNGLVITGEHRFSFDITIPYNNRILLEVLISVPIEARIQDEVYQRIRQMKNPDIDNTGIAVTNLKHTKNRARAEALYYSLQSCTGRRFPRRCGNTVPYDPRADSRSLPR